jgi:hypothetical protein
VAGEFHDAIIRYQERREAAGKSHGDRSDYDEMAVMWSGLDLDIAEMVDIKVPIAASALDGMMRGMAPHGVAASMYLDGMVVGLLIAEARQKTEARA